MTCHGQWYTSQIAASHHAVVVLLVLKSHPGLANPTGATSKLVLASCSSKPCWSFVAFEHRWSKRSQKVQSKRVKLRSCRRPPVFQGDPALCWKKEDALPWVLTIDLTCHGQWDTSKVRRQPPCSGSFACLKKPSWSCHPHWCHRQNLQQ